MIYFYLHKYKTNYSIEELYDIAAIGLCKAAITYNSEKSKFTTYALSCINNEVNHELRKTTAAKCVPQSAQISLCQSTGEGEGMTLESLLEDETKFEDNVLTAVVFNQFWLELNEREKEMLSLINVGLKQDAVAKELNVSQAQVSRILTKLRTKFKQICN